MSGFPLSPPAFPDDRSAPLTLALSKGRIFDEILPLLAAAGVEVTEDPERSRKLILATSDTRLRVIIVRATDVPTYVESGAADFGVAGKDVLLEYDGSGLYQLIDLGIARCRMAVAVPAGFDYRNAIRQGARVRVATKYTQVAREHFAAKGMHVDLIKLYGSMELAPLVGLADAIVDLVSSGGTLRANNLVEVEEIMPISSRLVVNRASLKLKRRALTPYLEIFARVSAQADDSIRTNRASEADKAGRRGEAGRAHDPIEAAGRPARAALPGESGRT